MRKNILILLCLFLLIGCNNSNNLETNENIQESSSTGNTTETLIENESISNTGEILNEKTVTGEIITEYNSNTDENINIEESNTLEEKTNIEELINEEITEVETDSKTQDLTENIDNEEFIITEGQISTGSLSITNESNLSKIIGNISLNSIGKVKNNQVCILGECLDADLKFEKNGDNYMAINNFTNEYDEENEFTYTFSDDYKSLVINKKLFMQTEVIKITNIGDYFIKSDRLIGCGGSTINQEVYDINGTLLTDFLPDEFSKSIKIGNIEYFPSIIGSDLKLTPIVFDATIKFFKDKDGNEKTFDSIEYFQNYATLETINTDKKLFKSYIANYSTNPNIYVIYTTNTYDGKSKKIINLGPNNDYLNSILDENLNVTNLEATNQILTFFSGNYAGLFRKTMEDERLYKAKEEYLPIFRVEKIDDFGNYIIYPNVGFRIYAFAEMCKPVVYYYSKKSEENTLNLDLNNGDYFTKLIPEFNTENGWDFISNNGKITVENKDYDYLYYSLVNIGFEHNKNGWIVKGENIKKFFEDKLSKIGFTEAEKDDFINYWVDKYEDEKYYFVSFKYKDELDKIIKLDFSSKVDSEFRVLLDSYELINPNLDEYKDFLYENVGDKFDDILIKNFDRGNTDREVFEWGGVLQRFDKTIIK